MRCDNALPGRPVVGCVSPGYVSVLVYPRSGLYPEVARHIGDAQASGLRGAYPNGTPLTRLTNAALVDRNRATACPSSYPRPAGKSCDEYPFASTNQGASTGGGGPRTFSYCSITLGQPGSTGATGYSVCMVNATQNSGAGTALGQFYNSNRAISNDPFRVWISP